MTHTIFTKRYLMEAKLELLESYLFMQNFVKHNWSGKSLEPVAVASETQVADTCPNPSLSVKLLQTDTTDPKPAASVQ